MPILLSASEEITRPANTTAYTALDAIGISLAVTGATNATPVVLTTGTHDLADGDPVTVASVGGNTNANGNYFAKVTGYSSTTFALYSDITLATAVAGNGAYTSGGTVARLLVFDEVALGAGLGGYIVKAQLATDLKTYTGRVRLHLFNAPVAAILDNSPYLTLYASFANRIGTIDFPACATEDSTNSTQATAEVVIGESKLPKGFTVGAQKKLFGMMEDLDAKTPASGQKFTVKLLIEPVKS